MEQIFTQFGIAGAILFVLYFTIKVILQHFINSIAEERKSREKMAKDFSATVKKIHASQQKMMSESNRVISENTKILSQHIKVRA